MHVITDSFAHQAYMKDKNGNWYRLYHKRGSEDSCDSYTYDLYKNRFQCAKDAACGTLFSYTFKEYLSKQENLDKEDLEIFKPEINKMNYDY